MLKRKRSEEPAGDESAGDEPRTKKAKHTQQEQEDEASSSRPIAKRKTVGSPIFFFRGSEKPYGYLSQWYKCQFTDPESNMTFNCAEQWMMWKKAQLAGDSATANLIMAAISPGKQKTLGRKVRNLNLAAWDEHKSKIVEQGNYLKFAQGTNAASMKKGATGEAVILRELLLATDERELVEASSKDKIWGIGFSAQQVQTTPREKWGQNLLGQALMKVREQLREIEI